MIYVKKELEKTARNSIQLDISGKPSGLTKFGGVPDVPENFQWPRYEGESMFTDEVKPRPLAFLAQFDLANIAQFDTDNMLPKTGLLSFFYDLETMKWGFDPKDKGSARVFYFEDANALSPAEFPEELKENPLGESYLFPELGISAKTEKSYQSYEDFIVQHDKMFLEWDEFDEVLESMGVEESDDLDPRSKLLGWADIIQGNMTQQCELVSRGYYMGNEEGYNRITPQDLQESKQWANRDWLLLFQLGTVKTDGFELMFGDCGRIYFYIRREDLAARNFDNVWLILQCG
ncbi:MAG: YwqG family protein [Lachnospiraceae bacterium]|nr:YwqG family protein [Ruminococcus sp.]MCM1275835.1 YwqG family protein [Lachnospiraceae bacterium]